MHGGVLIQLRQSIEHVRYAKPWQQALFSSALILLGVTLIALGELVWILLALLGVLFARPAVRRHLRRPSYSPERRMRLT
jgi:hypothetical protein